LEKSAENKLFGHSKDHMAAGAHRSQPFLLTTLYTAEYYIAATLQQHASALYFLPSKALEMQSL